MLSRACRSRRPSRESVAAVIFAQADGGAGAATTLIWFGILAAVFYFLLIRPQRQRSRRQQELAASLVLGDEVRTAGGLYGSIVALDESTATLAVEQGRVKVARTAIVTKVGGDVEEEAE